MPTLSRRVVLALSAGFFAAGGAIARAQQKELSGSVIYRERMALPRGARVEVQLVDVSLADAPAKVIAETVIEDAVGSPIPYSLSYDASLIEPRHDYALQARISVGERLLFINTSRHPALHEEGASADILVQHVAGQGGEAPSSLAGQWLAEDILGGGVVDNVQTTLEIAEDGSVSGSGGCNRYSGRATLQGGDISFEPMVSTQMGCVEAIQNQEQAFHEALTRVVSFRVDAAQGKLHLLDGEGVEVLRLARM